MTRLLRSRPVHLWRTAALLALLILSLLSVIPRSAAHGYVIRSIPQDRVTLERPPTRLQYWFSEALEPQFSRINLRNQAGEVIAEGGVDETDNTLLKLRVPTDLPDGAYIVELAPAFASDGHVIVESRVFFVGEEVGGVQSQGASDAAIPLEVAWKALLYNGVFLLFGTYLLYAYVLVPVWGNPRHPSGLLPPRVMRRLNRIIWGAIVVTVLGSLLALVQQTMVFFNVGASQAITGGLWQIVLGGSRFGDVWRARMFFLVIIVAMQGASLYFWQTYPRTVRSFWTANVWVAALMVGAQAVNSHAAGSLVMPWVAVFVHWLHTLAVAFWLGGIAALALVLPVALEPYKSTERWQALRPLMRRFSRYTVSAVLLTVTGGIYLATNYMFTPGEVTTTYGAALGYKLILVAALLGVGALHHVALRPHLLERVPDTLKRASEWARGFTGSLRLETVLAVVALTAASLLSATPTPEPVFLDEEVATPIATQQVGGYEVQASLLPGGLGVNTYDTVVRQNGAAVTDVRVDLQLVAPERGVRGEWHPAEMVDDGLFVTAGDEIDTGGAWWSLIDIFAPDGTLTRAAFAWNIDADASVIQQVPPTPLNLLALAAVMAAIGYAVLPSARALMRRLQWSAATITIAVGAIVLSTVLVVGSILFLEQQVNQLDAQLNPPPTLVNPILPDNASVQRGEELYNAHCLRWQTSPDFLVLLRSIGEMRAATLYAITQEGWRDVPACSGELSDTERWHIVNYARTLRTRAE